jgi:hypothetical protein
VNKDARTAYTKKTVYEYAREQGLFRVLNDEMEVRLVLAGVDPENILALEVLTDPDTFAPQMAVGVWSAPKQCAYYIIPMVLLHQTDTPRYTLGRPVPGSYPDASVMFVKP